MLFVLTGVSGTGKTTVLDALRGELAEGTYLLADIDQDGVPAGADERWRRSQVERWLAEAARRAEQGSSVVLSGTVVPTDVPQGIEANSSVRFCLLRARAEVLRSRLKMRYAAPEAAADLMRVVGQDVDSFVDRTIRSQSGFERAFESAGVEYPVVDTSVISINEARDRVLRLIRGTD